MNRVSQGWSWVKNKFWTEKEEIVEIKDSYEEKGKQKQQQQQKENIEIEENKNDQKENALFLLKSENILSNSEEITPIKNTLEVQNELLKKKIKEMEALLKTENDRFEKKSRMYEQLHELYEMKKEEVVSLTDELNLIKRSFKKVPDDLKETKYLYYCNNPKVRFNTKKNLLETIHEEKKSDVVVCSSNISKISDTMSL